MDIKIISKLLGKKSEQEKTIDYIRSYLKPIPEKINEVVEPVKDWKYICEVTGFEQQ